MYVKPYGNLQKYNACVMINIKGIGGNTSIWAVKDPKMYQRFIIDRLRNSVYDVEDFITYCIYSTRSQTAHVRVTAQQVYKTLDLLSQIDPISYKSFIRHFQRYSPDSSIYYGFVNEKMKVVHQWISDYIQGNIQ